MGMMELYVEDFWDDRNWQLGLKTDNPVDFYQKYIAERVSLRNAPAVDELPAHEKAWLRAVE